MELAQPRTGEGPSVSRSSVSRSASAGARSGAASKMTSALDVVGSNDTGEQAAMADAMEDARQL
jgi:hypothetical protein